MPTSSSGTSSPVFTEVIRGPIQYTVRSGDTLMAIAGRLGVKWHDVASVNGLAHPDRIYPGQHLWIETSRIVPALLRDGIVINIPESILYYFEDGRLVFHAGVGLGKPGQWSTPTGTFTILKRQYEPTWEVPRSIQEEMESEGRTVVTKVPPGPDNPLGEFWLGLSIPGCGVHGTIEPSSIGQYRSHGCIRMHPEDIEQLFPRVLVGTPGQLVYETVKVARVGDRIYLEVHADVYQRNINLYSEAEARLRMLDVPIDWNRVEEVVRKQSGVAEEVTLAAAL
jgi:L,D-transpeptidase ErfK/SrfK